MSNYLKTIFQLAKRESFQGTGKRRWAARGRRQQESQQQAVELSAAAGTAVRGAAQNLTLLHTQDQGQD